ncbi:MAG: AAA family ATPase [Candidatus Omnitrophica bacterium]|nr:AAA family ATPase [Candidatus Omnitrophota bacterium]
MGFVIAIAGKGGSGKTTIAGLLIRILKERSAGSILGIDADPNHNLGDVLGMDVSGTIGQMLDGISSDPGTIPAGMSKDRYIEYKIQTLVQEGEGFDILTMGRPEGPGCYCYVNNVLRNTMGKLVKGYDYVVIDNEAGLEHFSRRTTGSANVLIVVSDPSVVGLKAAERIHGLVRDLKIKTKHNCLIINRFPGPADAEKIKKTGLAYIGNIPEDGIVRNLSIEGGSVMGLDNDALSLNSLRKIGEKIWGSN